MRPSIPSVALLTVALSISVARADDLATAKAHYDRGTMLYDLQRFGDAAKEYETAYELKQDPALLFNIGQAYRFAHNYEKAIGAFKSYLRRVPDASNRTEVEGRIAEMEKLQAEQQKSQEKPPAGTIQPTAQPTPEPPVSKPSAPAATPPAPLAQPSPADRSTGRKLTVTGIAVGAVGVAALGAGIAFAVLANSAYDEINSPSPGYVFNPSTQDQIGTDQALEAAFFAIGGAAMVTGVALAVLGVRRSRRTERVAVAPLLGPGSGGAFVRFSF